ncbi:hypothetical protein FS842_002768 [Serendipita sp. 407]|nr:hypothetical protein FS842_002768 [Serendipita sp. 407]
MSTPKVLVLGSGNFGSCLSDHLADAGSSVLLWSRSAEVVRSMNQEQKNVRMSSQASGLFCLLFRLKTFGAF